MKRMLNSIIDFIKSNFVILLLIIAIFTVTFVRLPYQVEMPGGIIDLENRVEVNGEVTDIEGSFNMAYVSVAYGDIYHLILGLILPDWSIVPDSETMYENETVEDATARSKIYLEQSKDYAVAAALSVAEIPFEIENKVNHVAYIAPEAKTDLKIGDNILKFNGQEVYDLNEFKEYIKETPVDTKVVLEVERDGEIVDVEGVIYEEKDNHYIGISVITTFDIISDLNVNIKTKSSESGPSGGMMMALMVYNSITKQDLTKGKKIVGTGTIDLDGNVGEIGGIKYKLMGAVNNNADVFLVPVDNYEEAMKVKKEKGYDIKIVSVEKLTDAIEYLEGME